MPKVTFNNRNSVFYSALKSEVEKYFINKGIKKTGNWKLYLKSVILISTAIGLYLLLLTVSMPALPSLLLCALLGITFSCIGFSVMHDACHGSYSQSSRLNYVMGLTANALGANAFMWKQKHNVIHHTYTNVDGIDDDIAKSPLIRQCHTQKWVPAHRVQHLYLPFVYSITSLAWIMIMDFVKYSTKMVHKTPLQKMDTKEHIIFWVTKVCYVFFYMALPMYLVGFLPWLFGFIAMHVAEGLSLAIVFQLAHVVEHAEFEVATEDPKVIESEWAVYQVKTTANFAPRNKVIGWMVGGLNFQIEHHLFPKISHVHYPAISKIVQKVCREHGIFYNQFPTMWAAMISHFKMMKEFGRPPQVQAQAQAA